MNERDLLVGYAKQELARRGLLAYCQVISHGFQSARHTTFLCEKLEELERGEIDRLIINAPPGFGKSTLLQCFASWFIGRDPRRRVLMLSASEALALRNSRAIREQVTNEVWPWPNIKLSSDSTSVQNWTLDAGGGLRAIGQGGTVTGFRSELIICDDLQADAGSPATRDTLEDWFRSVLSTRLEPNGKACLIQTRWTTDDVIARLLEGESGDQWTVINLPAIAGDDDPYLGREPGESLWPERWPIEILEKRRAEVGSFAWESQYMGVPTPEGGRVFAPEWFSKRYTELPTFIEPQGDMNVYGTPFYDIRPKYNPPIVVTALDAALKDNVGSDFSAICTVLYDRVDMHVIEVERARLPFDRLLAMLIDHYNRHEPRAVLIEDTALGAPAVTELQRATALPVIPIKPVGSKVSRAMGIVPYVEAGHVILPHAASWLRDFLPELLAFPGGRNDDQVDAFVMAVSWAHAIAAHEQHYEEMHERFRGTLGVIGR